MAKTFECRDYQQRILDRARENWNRGATSQLVESPPGSGKTVMGFSICKELVESISDLTKGKYKPEDVGIGWVAMRRNLLSQAEIENNQLIGCPNVHYVSQFDKDPAENLKDYPLRVLVFDEAHHEATGSAHNVLNTVDPEYVIGLSATPQRADNMKLCFQANLKDAGFYTLIEKGYLSEFDHWMIEEWTPKEVASAYLEDPDRWGKSIMFFRTIEECEECEAILKKKGVRCDIVTGKTDRFSQLDAFESGEVDVLINMFVLTEGFDCPELETVWVRDSRRLPVIQMAGRVLRMHPDGKTANIVQSVKTKFPFTREANIANNQYVKQHGQWKTIGVSDAVIQKAQQMFALMAQTDIDNETLKALSKGRKRQRNHLLRDDD